MRSGTDNESAPGAPSIPGKRASQTADSVARSLFVRLEASLELPRVWKSATVAASLSASYNGATNAQRATGDSVHASGNEENSGQFHCGFSRVGLSRSA